MATETKISPFAQKKPDLDCSFHSRAVDTKRVSPKSSSIVVKITEMKGFFPLGFGEGACPEVLEAVGRGGKGGTAELLFCREESPFC